MTIICSHRVNSAAVLGTVDEKYGVEMDLRSHGEQIHLVHDPFVLGEKFEEWLDAYHHAFIVLNVKEEGLEDRIMEILNRRGINAWAFLDQSVPFLVRTLRGGESRCMVRVSEYESIETALSLPNRPDWVWLDSFTGGLPSAADIRRLHDHGFQMMVASPELQGRDLAAEISGITELFVSAGVPLAGVCTKRPEVWNSAYAPGSSA